MAKAKKSAKRRSKKACRPRKAGEQLRKQRLAKKAHKRRPRRTGACTTKRAAKTLGHRGGVAPHKKRKGKRRANPSVAAANPSRKRRMPRSAGARRPRKTPLMEWLFSPPF